MRLITLSLAAAGALALAACSGGEDTTATEAADAGADTGAMAPADGTMAPTDGSMPADGATTTNPDGSMTSPDGTTTTPGTNPPPTLPPEGDTPGTTPPAQ